MDFSSYIMRTTDFFVCHSPVFADAPEERADTLYPKSFRPVALLVVMGDFFSSHLLARMPIFFSKSGLAAQPFRSSGCRRVHCRRSSRALSFTVTDTFRTTIIFEKSANLFLTITQPISMIP